MVWVMLFGFLIMGYFQVGIDYCLGSFGFCQVVCLVCYGVQGFGMYQDFGQLCGQFGCVGRFLWQQVVGVVVYQEFGIVGLVIVDCVR